MIVRTVLTFLVAVALLGSLGCRKEGTGTAGGKTGAAKPAAPPTSVGGQQPGTGTAQEPPAGTTRPPATAGGTEPNATASGRTPSTTSGQPTGVTTEISTKTK